MKHLIIYFVFSILFIGCDKQKETPVERGTLSKLFIKPKSDTLFLNINEARSVTLNGVYLDKTQTTVTNTGVITSSEFTVVTIDSIFRSVNINDARWYSSQSSVVQASPGSIKALASGTGYVWAECQGIKSDSILVNARIKDVAPGLILDPPDVILTFQNSVHISGTVQTSSRLCIEELGTNFLDTSYNTNGYFQKTITGLNTGLSQVTVKALHSTRNDLVNVRNKTVFYYTYYSPAADSIVGAWHGECGGRPINFIVSKSALVSRYDISGTIDIQILNYGLIQDVQLFGIVNNDGSFNLSATKTFEGFTVSGSLNGQFHTVGKANGSITGSLKKSGWLNLSFKESWWAIKL